MNARIALLLPLLATGCATPPPVIEQSPTPPVLAAVAPTKPVEARYEIRSYHEAPNPSLRHEAHAVFRRTHVPIADTAYFATVPLTAHPPPSQAPLPPSEELAAELATQKRITREVRALQTSLAETQQQMQAQYAALVRQSADTVRLREQLEAERQRVRLPMPAPAPPAPSPPPAAVSASPIRPEVKW